MARMTEEEAALLDEEITNVDIPLKFGGDVGMFTRQRNLVEERYIRIMDDQTERDMNLMVVAAAEGYAGRHGMPTAEAFALLTRHGVVEEIRRNYNSLHTQSLDESVYFAEDVLKRRMG